ncbi:hypothetical protein [Caulobacter sp.]|uniref:hypothetical protein n=1 Tax=Caulobacter sp. TaxID=78 RepID=UPI003BB017C7
MRRLLAALAAIVGVLPSASPAATALSPQAAPASWVAYAGLVNQTIIDQLGGSDPAAVRLRNYLDQLPHPMADSRAQLPIRVWIDGQGVINKVDFTPFAHPEPNADLRALLLGQRLAKAPPRDMLLPLRLSIGLEPAPATEAPSPGRSPGGAVSRTSGFR